MLDLETILKIDPNAMVLPNGNIRFMTLRFQPGGTPEHVPDEDLEDAEDDDEDTEIFVRPGYEPQPSPQIPFQYPQENPEKNEKNGKS
jgi:hypothetical protein